MAAEVRDIVLRTLPRTLLVPMEPRVFTPARATPDVSWSRTFTGTSTVTVLVENDDLLSAEEFEAVARGEAEIDAGEFVTLSELEKSLDE